MLSLSKGTHLWTGLSSASSTAVPDAAQTEAPANHTRNTANPTSSAYFIIMTDWKNRNWDWILNLRTQFPYLNQHIFHPSQETDTSKKGSMGEKVGKYQREI